MRLAVTMLMAWTLEIQAAPTYDTVYRTDSRDMNAIAEAGGMFPWPGEMLDADLLHHFEGESVEGQVSAFVSTTSSLAQAVLHAASLARPNSEVAFDADFSTYIYAIRPAGNFYDVEAALSHARDNAAPDSTLRIRLARLLHDYGGMDELVALNGFRVDRILRYARLDGSMLNRYGVSSGSPLLSDRFWAERWQTNGTHYDRAFDRDTSASAIYPGVAIHSLPAGVRQVIRNGSQPDVPLAFACDSVAQGLGATASVVPVSAHHGAQASFFADRKRNQTQTQTQNQTQNPHRELKRRSVRGAPSPCAGREYHHIRPVYYDKDRLHMFYSPRVRVAVGSERGRADASWALAGRLAKEGSSDYNDDQVLSSFYALILACRHI